MRRTVSGACNTDSRSLGTVGPRSIRPAPPPWMAPGTHRRARITARSVAVTPRRMRQATVRPGSTPTATATVRPPHARVL